MQRTSENLQFPSQTTTIKQILQEKKDSHESFGFPVDVKVMFTLHWSLLSVQ